MIRFLQEKKKLLLLVSVLVLALSAPVFAGVDVILNGEPLVFGSMRIDEGRLLVPADALAHYLGGSISMDEHSGIIRIFANGTMVQMRAGEMTALIKGEPAEMDVSPIFLDGRMLVPLRFVVEAFMGTIAWNDEVRAVEIAMKGEVVTEAFPSEHVVQYTPEELDLLIRCISSEAGNQSFEGMVAVGAVVINRVLSPNFPNTIEEVIMQPGQFSVVADNRINLPVKPGAEEAALVALTGEDPSGGSLYFYNPVTARAAFVFTRPTVTVIGDHVFAK